MIEERDVFEIQPSDASFETWSNTPFIDEGLRNNIRNSAILLVPTVGFRQKDIPTFPTLTEDIFHYLQEHIPMEFPVEICISDENFNMLALHSDYKRLGNFLVLSVALPIFLGVFSNYISSRIIAPQESKPPVIIKNIVQPVIKPHLAQPSNPAKPHKKEHPHKYLEPSKVTFTIIVQDTVGKSTNFHYEGPVSGVKTVTDQIEKTFLNEHKKTGN
jgi:hypothetical protein